MSDDEELRDEWRTLADHDHNLRVAQGDDHILESARYQIARADIETWDMRGTVPAGIWGVMREWERRAVRSETSDRIDRKMFIGFSMMVAFSSTVAIPVGGWVRVVLMIVTTSIAGLIAAKAIRPTRGPYRHMKPPGTATMLKHTARTYEVANGMLTLASEARGGELTVATGGELEVCDEC